MSYAESLSHSDNEEVVPIVDCDVLEAAKENIQPLAAGRRVTTLSAIFSTPHAQRDAHLAAARSRHRAAVDAALKATEPEDADAPEALEAYARFVHWTIEHYPQGHSAESGILELLEEATRALKDNAKCRGNVQYLKLWVLYASYVERPAVIYAYLLANEIGTAHAMLYEEYALSLERDGRRTHADEIYLLGIARKAEPLGHLQNRHRDFQKRMMASTTIPTAVREAPLPSSAAPQRTILGTTGGSRSSTLQSGSRHVPVLNETEDVFGAHPSTSSISASSSGTIARPALSSNARMQIFVDPEGEKAQEGEGNPWPELGTRKTRIKENVRKPSKAAGTTLKQSGVKTASSKIVPYRDQVADKEVVEETSMPPPNVVPKTPAKPAFVPFCDADEDVVQTPKSTPFRHDNDTTGAVVPGSVMRQKNLKAESEAEALRKDPFKNYNDLKGVDI